MDMKIYDISQEVFSCVVFPGDPKPEGEQVMSIRKGDMVNLTKLTMCAHNGTHVDAPYHFLDAGKKVDEMDLERLIGYAFVADHNGVVTAEDAKQIVEKARMASELCKRPDCDAYRRILIKGADTVVTEEAAVAFRDRKIYLLGNESQTVGPMEAPKQVHLTLLGAQVVLLEGIRLEAVPEGIYLLHAAPINLGGCDGAPCRATLISEEEYE